MSSALDTLKNLLGYKKYFPFKDKGDINIALDIENEYPNFVQDVVEKLDALGIEYSRTKTYLLIPKAAIEGRGVPKNKFESAAEKVKDLKEHPLKPDDFKFAIFGTFGGFDKWAGDKGAEAHDTRTPREDKMVRIASYDGVSYSYSKASTYERHLEQPIDPRDIHPLLDSRGDLRAGNITFAVNVGNRLLTDYKKITAYLDDVFDRIYKDRAVVGDTGRIDFGNFNSREIEAHFAGIIKEVKDSLPAAIGDGFVELSDNINSNYHKNAEFNTATDLEQVRDALADGNRVYLHKNFKKTKYERPEPVAAPVQADDKGKGLVKNILGFFSRG
jgi:hypothetical protein